MRRHTLALIGMATILATSTLQAQEVQPGHPPTAKAEETRRDYETPGLMLETTGRPAACDVFMFTKDGKYLLAAGDDKVVRTWRTTEAGLEAQSEYPTLRWPIYRERRGDIYAAALSPDETKIAVAGYARKGGAFGAAVIDRKSGKLIAEISDDSLPKSPGSVWHCEFSPDGHRIALGTENGIALVWTWESTPSKLAIVHEFERHAASSRYDRVRLASFIDDRELILIDGHGRIRSVDLATGKATPHPKLPYPTVSRIAWSPDRRMVGYVAETHPDCFLLLKRGEWDKPVKRMTNLENPSPDTFLIPHQLAYSPDGRTLALSFRENSPSNGPPGFTREGRGRVVFYPVAESDSAPGHAEGPRQSLYGDALAWNPADSTRLAVSGGDDHEIAYWKMGEYRQPLSVVVAEGKAIWSCAISPDGRYFAYQNSRHPEAAHPNRRGRGSWICFDASPSGMKFAENPPGFDPDKVADRALASSCGDWEIVSRDESGVRSDLWSLRNRITGKTTPLQWDKLADSFPRCYAFVPATGNGNPRLLVGHYYGFSEFECAVETDESGRTVIPRRRLFRGHEGEVVGIAAAVGDRIVTCSTDMTIAGWNLAPLPFHPHLGAQLRQEGDRVVVGKVSPGSPAWEMGLGDGTELASLAINTGRGDLVYNRLAGYYGGKIRGGFDDLMKRLEHPVAGRSHIFGWHAAGSRKPVCEQTTFVQRPVWRFFPSGERDWILWRYRDYYYDCSTNGDRSIGWQRSYESGQSPDFYPASHFREIYRKPALVREMLGSWETLDSGEGSRVARFNETEPPRIVMSAPAKVDSPTVGVSIAIEPPHGQPDYIGNNQRPTRLLLWVNDFLFEDRDLSTVKSGDRRTLLNIGIPAGRFRGGRNILLVQCYNHGGARSQQVREIESPKREGKPALYVCAFGIGDYANQPDLYSATDSAHLDESWKKQERTGHYSAVRPSFKTNGEVTAKSLVGEIERLKDVVEPNDRLVLFLSGHGASRDQLKQAILDKARADKKEGDPEVRRWLNQLDGAGRYLFLLHDFDPGRIADTTVGFERIHDSLAKLNCHKILLLDTCHAGSARESAQDRDANPIQILSQHGVGCLILASCRPDESAIEMADAPARDRKFRGAFRSDFHDEIAGLFSCAIDHTLNAGDAFDRAAGTPGRDQIDARQFFHGISGEVEAYCRRLKSGGIKNASQHPESFIPSGHPGLPLIYRTSNVGGDKP